MTLLGDLDTEHSILTRATDHFINPEKWSREVLRSYVGPVAFEGHVAAMDGGDGDDVPRPGDEPWQARQHLADARLVDARQPAAAGGVQGVILLALVMTGVVSC